MKAPKLPPRDGHKLVQVVDGNAERWYKRKNGWAYYHTVCCDCGLTHREMIQNHQKYFSVRVWRDDELTEKFRGSRQIVKVKK